MLNHSRLLECAQRHPRRAATAVILTLTLAGLSGLLALPREQPRASHLMPTRLIEQRQREIVVYITRTGQKFHTQRCDYLRASKFETSLYDALKRGYEACSACRARRVLRETEEGD